MIQLGRFVVWLVALVAGASIVLFAMSRADGPALVRALLVAGGLVAGALSVAGTMSVAERVCPGLTRAPREQLGSRSARPSRAEVAVALIGAGVIACAVFAFVASSRLF